ncbi:MAG: alpha/beta hydrolase fold domain-containing protein [Oligoflexia bacterium]|nr:alpha/beta hydrolase fold domain-containing protein [Oligoflexia bacterium]
MKALTLTLLFGSFLLASLTCIAGSIPTETDWAKGTNWKYEKNFAGFPSAWVYTPNGFSKKVPAKRGAVIHLMGCDQVSFQIAQSAGWPKAAEAYGLVVVVPDVQAPVFPNQRIKQMECINYGGGYPMVTMPTRNSPDHKSIIAAGTKLVSDYPELEIDPNQIYLAGISAGGAVAMEVACMAPDVFSGVALAAAPGIGSNQSTAVMPPSIKTADMLKVCRDYSATAPGKPTMKDQVIALVSDDNSLPAGNITVVDGIVTADKFINQNIWDGDKFAPYPYQKMTADMMATLLGVKKAETGVVLGSGKGIGCAGGEKDRGDSYHECRPKDATPRDWKAYAEYWRDSAGRIRIARIEQDTLRHAWPAGPVSRGDFPGFPDVRWLVEQGYINASTGHFDMKKLGPAPNGMAGALFHSNASIDFPMFVAKLWSENNPKLNTR